MGMSMHVLGIPEREYFDKMIVLKKQCEELKVSVPDEVKKFFGSYYIESTECLEHEILFQDVVHRNWNNDHAQGFEIDVKDIPENIKTIRFYCSW